MFNSKSNYVIVIFMVFIFSCKKSKDNTQKSLDNNIKIFDGKNINQPKLDFNYADLVGKTFLPINLKEDGSYEYDGDINKEFDMGEDRIRFKKNMIKHLIPIEWHSQHILSKNIDNGWLKLNLIGNLKDINVKRAHFSYYFKYDKNKNLLFHSRHLESDHLEVFMDSVLIAKKEKTLIKNKKPINNHVVYKKHHITFNNKKIEISIPFVEPHLNEKGNQIFERGEIGKHLEIKILTKNKKSLFFVFNEGECGACPNFSSLYDENGNNLSYRYSIRRGQESIKLISHGNDDEIFASYGFTDRDVNIQINHKDTPTFTIKNWY